MEQEHDSQLYLKLSFLEQVTRGSVCNLPEDELHFSKTEIECMVEQPLCKGTHPPNDACHTLHIH